MKDYSRGSDIARAFDELRPRTLQANVQQIDLYANAGWYWVRLDGALFSVCIEAECHDGALWAHLSVGGKKPAREPSFREMRWCKDFFLGDRKAIQVLPPRSEYVNVHPHVLHLFSALEKDPLPDFRHKGPDGMVAI